MRDAPFLTSASLQKIQSTSGCSLPVFLPLNLLCKTHSGDAEAVAINSFFLCPCPHTCSHAEVADIIGKEVDVPASVFHVNNPGSFFRYFDQDFSACMHASMNE